jgi:hypothetical protein
MREAYAQLRSSVGNSGARTSFEEKRDNADLITLKLSQMYISHGNLTGFLE